MPCYNTGSAAADSLASPSEARKHATKMTQIACEALGILYDHGLLNKCKEETIKWFEHHQMVDMKRKADEARGKALEEKFSQEELDALKDWAMKKNR